jgi:hypothetical protein
LVAVVVRPGADETVVSMYQLDLKEVLSETVQGYRVPQPVPETTAPELEPPDLETLMEWEAEGGCEATDGCWVEPDGTCPHGHHSWLIHLGMI